MSPFAIEILGAVAACITSLCWAPQVLRIIRSRDTRSISLASQGAFAVGTAMWFVYGWLIGSWPVMAANGLTFVLIGTIVALKLRYG